jgi:hypothetical protein
VILHHVTNRPDLRVEASAAIDAELLCHRHLDAPDVLPIPERLQERIGEAEIEEILNGFLPQKMIDPAKWLLDHHAAASVTAAAGESRRYGGKQIRDREVVQRAGGVTERAP